MPSAVGTLQALHGCFVPDNWSVRDMDDRPTDWSLDDVNRRTAVAAALLMAVGGLVGAAGLLVGCGAVIAACRRWYRRVDLPPHELAKLKWEQAKAAAGASAGAWRDTESKMYVPRGTRATSSTT